MLLRSTEFKKRYAILSRKIQEKANARLELFVVNEFDLVLNNHPLHGNYEGCRSINVTGNIRIIYKKLNDTLYYLINIGTHPQLYE